MDNERTGNGSAGAGVAIVVLVLLALVFFIFALPALRTSSSESTKIEGEINLPDNVIPENKENTNY